MSILRTINTQSIKDAAEIIKSGGLVAFPTETVYGLGANALDKRAVARVFKVKGRPAINPLISHFYDVDAAAEHAVFDDRAKVLAQKFWPEALTLILPRKPESDICDLACAGLSSVAVRVPNHKDALVLLKACGVPLVAPSANKSGGLSPTTPQMVADSLGNHIDMILAAGCCKIGLESTVVDLLSDDVIILRQGAILAAQISDALGTKVLIQTEDNEEPRSPGQLLKHYAPDTPVRINAVDVKKGEALLAFGSIKFMGVQGGGAASSLPHDSYRNLSEGGDLYEAAARLFIYLKELDRPEHTGIAVMNIPDSGIGAAINERLKRAAAAHV